MLSPQRKNLNAVFASEKLESLNKIVKKFANMTINDVGYELKAVTVSDVQVKFASDPDGITHTRNGVTRQNLFSIRMIGI